jgi:hypothetical protein
VFVEGMRRRTREALQFYCEELGLGLRLHEYKGGWRLGVRGLAGRQVAPRVFFKRERCHLGICKARVAMPGIGYPDRAREFEMPGVETA